MKKTLIYLTLILLINNGKGIAQDSSRYNYKQDFNRFLELFYDVRFPSNYKKEFEEVGKSLHLNIIQKEDAIYYLKMKENQLEINDILYNYDTDEKTFVKKGNFPVAHLKYETQNFIALIYRYNPAKVLKEDTSLVYLQTVDINGKLIDKTIIGGQYTRENDWMSFVFLDSYHFKVFQYGVNWDNVQIKGKVYYIIDKNVPLTKLTIIDYEIDDNGNIKMIKEHPSILLKELVPEYKKYNSETDDPMNGY